MYIHNKAMENLRQCSRCKSNIDISYFGLNRKKEPYKTCDNCRNKGRAYQQKPKKRMPIDATDVAVILGLNKYNRDIFRLVLNCWKRGLYSDYMNIKNKLKQECVVFEVVKTSDEEIENVCEREGISFDFTILDDVDKLMEELNSIDDINVSNDDVTSFCNKQMGIQFEKSAIKKYEEQFNVVVNDEVNDYYVKKAFKDDGEYTWCVGGRCNGVTKKADKDIIIKIKNRKKHIYPAIPIYEVVQVYTYMYITDVNQASVVEVCGDEIKETHVCYNSFGYDMYVLRKLTNFCVFMEKFLNDTTMKERYMKCHTDEEQVEQINKELMEILNIKDIKQMRVSSIKNGITNTSC